MSSFPVFADALSRLHADIAIVRLIRAGIPADKISAVFPRRQAPNSVCCWLKNFNRVPVRSALPIAAAGLLGQLFRRGIRAADVERKLENLGLAPEMAERMLEKGRDGTIVLCVHARNETQAAVAWHIFKHVGAENITSVGAGEFAWTPRELPAMQPTLAGMAA
jgi:hypothetical protein